MALSKPIDLCNDPIAILLNSRFLFQKTLEEFRACHDLGVASRMLEEESLFTLDQCALKFRNLSCFGATLAEKVASVWCNTSIVFYRSLEKLRDKDPSKLLTKIAGNAKNIAKGFDYLSEKSTTLANMFTELKTGVTECGAQAVHVQEAFVAVFKEEERKRAEESKKKQQEFEEAKRKTDYLEGQLKQSRFKMGFNHIKEVFTASSLTAAVASVFSQQHDLRAQELDLQSAKDLEKQAELTCKEAQQRLLEQEDQRKKAEFLAKKLAVLMKALHNVSSACKSVAHYFELENERFTEWAQVKSGEELISKYEVKEECIEETIKNLQEHKSKLELHHQQMSIINSMYNFQPMPQPSDMFFQQITLMPDTVNLEHLGISFTFQ